VLRRRPIFIEFPPVQAGASFNVGDLKAKVEAAAAAAKGGGSAWIFCNVRARDGQPASVKVAVSNNRGSLPGDRF
jgi:hypothetical protein